MDNGTAKIVRFHKTGGPEVLKIEELPIPQPNAGEVRLRIKAIGLNRAEVMFRRGQYLASPTFPSHIGYEASGIVEAVGSGVDAGMIGKKYSTVPCFPVEEYGVYGEVAIVPAYALASYPEKLSFSEATSIWMQYLTAYGALIHYGQLTKGEYVIITAASSSVGIAAIEIAKAQGAISIATTRTAKKRDELLALGADHVIVTDEASLVESVKKITNGQGARIIFDPVVGPGIEALADAASFGATIFAYGNLSMQPTPFPLMQALSKGLSIKGYTLFEIVAQPELRKKAEQYVFNQIEKGNFKPKIARTFKLDDIVKAHEYMESNEQIGKIVVVTE